MSGMLLLHSSRVHRTRIIVSVGFHMLSMCSCAFPSGSPVFSHVGQLIINKLHLIVNECANVCVHGTVQLTGIPSRMYSNLITSFLRIGSGSSNTLIWIKQLLKKCLSE